MSDLRIAVGPDGDDEPTLWLCVDEADPVAILSRYQLSPKTRHLWPIIVYRAVGQVGEYGEASPLLNPQT